MQANQFVRRRLAFGACLFAFALFANAGAPPAEPASPDAPQIAFTNVRVFNGEDPRLSAPTTVIVQGTRIASIGAAPRAGARVIDGQGHTLMPGLIDAHVHVTMVNATYNDLMLDDVSYLHVRSTRGAHDMLLRGFTSVRDMGGPSFGLKRAIDEGSVPGPRIWPSGAVISQSGGHGDFRLRNQIPGNSSQPTHTELIGAGAIADGESAVLRRVREQLALGATQIKVTAGGGIVSQFDPIDVSQYTVREIRAAVEAAENWGTYVTVHAYTPRAVRAAVEAGVKCIEHGQLLDEATIQLIAEKGVWWSLQPFIAEAGAAEGFNRWDPRWLKQQQVFQGTDFAYRMARKHKIRVAWGTDLLLDPKVQHTQNAFLVRMLNWYSAPEVLRMATFDNAALLALAGPRNGYDAAVGVIRPDAYADLLLVAGNPLEDLRLVADPERNFRVIMKNGQIYKNTIGR